MKPFEAYTTYLAVKNHFERDGYDYFKYHGKVPAKVESFYGRRDRYFFEKLARRENLVEFLVANFLENDKNYARDLTHEEAERVYRDWSKRTSGLTYQFQQDLDKIDDLKAAIAVKDGQHPPLLKMMMKKTVTPETVLIIDSFVRFIDVWDEKLDDNLVWPSVKKRLVKYRPFFKFDRDKFKEILLNKYRKSE